MKIKWVCPVCSSTNVCEKTDHMQCFVCGEYYKEEPHTIERHAEEFSESSTPKYSIKEKIKFAKLLVDHGADPEVEFRDGTSAADMVWQKYLTDKSKDMKELVRVLGIKGLDLRDKK